MFEGYLYGMNTAIYDGADILSLEKRDFDSPIIHLQKEDLKKLQLGILAEQFLKYLSKKKVFLKGLNISLRLSFKNIWIKKN